MTASLTTLVSFDNSDGCEPRSGVIADAGKVFEVAKTAGRYATPTYSNRLLKNSLRSSVAAC